MSATATAAKIITNEAPLVIPPSLATQIGLVEATILQQLHYYIQKSNNIIDGIRWVYNTYSQWHEQFPFFSLRTIRRAFTNLENLKLIRSERLEAKNWYQRKWYTVCYETLEALISPMCPNWPDRSGQFGHIDPANLAPSYTKTSTKESLKKQKHPIPSPHPVEELIGGGVDEVPNSIGLAGEAQSVLIEPEQALLLEEVKAEIAPQVLHPKLKKLVLNFGTSAIQQALNVVREAKQKSKHIKNPTGLLRSALENGWKSNQPDNKQSLPESFSRWFNAARAAEVVIGSQVIDGQVWVYDRKAEPIPYEQMVLLHPLERLRRESGLTLEKEPLTPSVGFVEPFDCSDVLAMIDTQFLRLQWSAERIREFLVQVYGKHSRALLADTELLDLQARLQTF